jgi:6-phosphogluconolactonase
VLYLGSYSSQGGPGIALATARNGVLVAGPAAADCPEDPTFLALAPGGRRLYAVHELPEGLVSAFAVGDGGRLRLLGVQPSGGAQPIHLSVHPSGRYLLVANWGSGSVAVHPLAADGAPGPATDVVANPQRHAHMMVTDPTGRWVLAVHLGANAVFTYDLDPKSGRLGLQSELRLHHGAGPRHLAFHPDRTSAYVVNELDATVTACAYDGHSGRLRPRETVPTTTSGTPADTYPSAVLVSPDGRFVYVANRVVDQHGHDSVAVLATQPRLRLVATVPCARFPRDAALADGGLLWVACEHAGVVEGLAVDRVRGSLRPAGLTVAVAKPTCVLPA